MEKEQIRMTENREFVMSPNELGTVINSSIRNLDDHRKPAPDTKSFMQVTELNIQNIKEGINKLVKWTENADDHFVKKIDLESQICEIKDSHKQLAGVVTKIVWTSVINILGFLVFVVFFLISNYVVGPRT